MINLIHNTNISTAKLNIRYVKANYKKFSSKNDINKKVSICKIKSVNHYMNLNQPLTRSQLLEDNRGKAGVYM
jgi:glutamate synthase domain-containing protein 1